MCGVLHNPAVVTKNPIYIWGCGSRGSASHFREEYKKAIKVGDDICSYTCVVRFWAPCRMCVFGICGVYTYTQSYEVRHLTIILHQQRQQKKGKYPEAFLKQ